MSSKAKPMPAAIIQAEQHTEDYDNTTGLSHLAGLMANYGKTEDNYLSDSNNNKIALAKYMSKLVIPPYKDFADWYVKKTQKQAGAFKQHMIALMTKAKGFPANADPDRYYGNIMNRDGVALCAAYLCKHGENVTFINFADLLEKAKGEKAEGKLDSVLGKQQAARKGKGAKQNVKTNSHNGDVAGKALAVKPLNTGADIAIELVAQNLPNPLRTAVQSVIVLLGNAPSQEDLQELAPLVKYVNKIKPEKKA